mgnify:CR=1 FL=1
MSSTKRGLSLIFLLLAGCATSLPQISEEKLPATAEPGPLSPPAHTSAAEYQ